MRSQKKMAEMKPLLFQAGVFEQVQNTTTLLMAFFFFFNSVFQEKQNPVRGNEESSTVQFPNLLVET